MKLKELVGVINNKAYLNMETERGQWLYKGQANFITSDLLERRVKLVDIIRNEFYITMEDQ